ncbi:AraC family transcriptional regulator [Ectothiorhodospiraceae bacterium WFHF3C12]|nr:AraC family transcriptional regulator [Ectothiorhodospiraceae bacterium WFHF3C12]
MTHQEDYTAVAGWVVTAARAMNARGVEATEVMSACGLDPAVLRDPDLRVPIQRVNSLLEVACEATGDPAFPLRLASYAHPSTFSILGYSMMASESLRDMLERLARYKRIVSDTCRLELRETPDTVALQMRLACDSEGRPVLSQHSICGFFSVVLRFMRHLHDPEFAPRSAGLTGKPPRFADALADDLDCRISFGATANHLVFDRALLEAPLPTANPQITRLHERLLVQSIARLDREDMVSAVRSQIMDSLPMGPPTQAELARRLHLSRRHLQRKLGNQGTSYKTLLDETRRSLALQHLQEGQLSLGEISYMLGFSSVNNFSRAFQRWMGLPPGLYRQRGNHKVA